VNKKKRERLDREIAQRESDAQSKSEDRQERIRVLWGLKEQDPKAKTYWERKLNEQKLKEQKLKKLLNCIKDLAENDELADQLGELVELAGLQDREIEYLTRFRRDWERILAYYPEQLKNLSTESLMVEVRPLIEKRVAEERPKEVYERKRRWYQWAGAGVGLIGREFGGTGEAEWRKSSLSGLFGPPYQPSCLDDILRGGVGEVKMLPSFAGQPLTAVDTVTNMRRLEVLFGMHRNRFPKKLPSRRMGREIVYDWRAVVEIMDALLSEKPGERKRSARGRRRLLWLSDPDLRNRVLSGIEALVNSRSVQNEIGSAFLTLVRRHRADSAKK
jgi:hypothetical protein